MVVGTVWGVGDYIRFMGLVLMLTVVMGCVVSISGQMRHFDSIIYCASSIRTLVQDINQIATNYQDPQATIATGAKILKNLPELLDNCGKQIHAKAYRGLLSKQCIDLHELEASFTIKRLRLIGEGKDGNALLVSLYSRLIEIIDRRQAEKCGFLNIQLKDLLIQSVQKSQCIKQGQQLIESFKGKSPTLDPISIFADLPFLLERVYSTGRICIQEYRQYFPLLCLGEISKVITLASTMGQYKTAASWIWDNIYTLKASMASIKEQCPKLLQLLLF